MFLLYVFLLILVVAVVLPFCRWGIHRMCLKRRMKALCRKKGCMLHTSGPLWFLGTRYGKNADFALATETDVYAVKLFGVPRRHTALILHDEEKYSLRWMMGLLLQVRFHGDSRPEPFPAYDFQAVAPQLNVPRQNLLLINPCPMKMLYRNREGQEKGFVLGDSFQQMRILTIKEMEDMLS